MAYILILVVILPSVVHFFNKAERQSYHPFPEHWHKLLMRLQFERNDIPLTQRLRMNLMWNTDKEYMGALRYIVTQNLGITTHYDSDMGLGIGATLNY